MKKKKAWQSRPARPASAEHVLRRRRLPAAGGSLAETRPAASGAAERA